MIPGNLQAHEDSVIDLSHLPVETGSVGILGKRQSRPGVVGRLRLGESRTQNTSAIGQPMSV